MPGGSPFDVDPGPPPRQPPDQPTTADAPPAADGPLTPPPLLEDTGPDLGKISDGVRGFYRFAFGLLHHTVGRGGPPDAFVPTEHELADMVRPAVAVIARSPRAATVAEHGGALDAVGTPAAYLVAEAERVSTYKRRQAAAEPPDADVAGLGIGEERPRRPRPWRPGIVPVEVDPDE